MSVRQSLNILLLLLSAVFAVDYYIESAPTSPRLCTLVRPCTYGLLPSLTSADTVHFLPATTGTSSTYSLGTKTIIGASVSIVSPSIVFSNTNLRNTFSTSMIVNGARFNGGSLGSQGVSSVDVQNVNFTNGAYFVLDGESVAVSSSVFSGVTGSNRHIIYATAASATDLQFSDSKSSGHFLSFQPSVTFTADSSVEMDTVSFSNCNTTSSSSSILVVQSNSGKTIDAGSIGGLSFSNCNSKAALLLTRCLFQSTSTPFSIISSIIGMTVTGGSVFKGLIALESAAAFGTISHTTESLSAAGVDFNSGAVYTLSTAGSMITQNTAMSTSNTVCSPSNLNYIAACSAVSGAPVYLDYALIKGTYAGVAIGPFSACTNTTLEIQEVCGMN